jgi:hypothetical protein
MGKAHALGYRAMLVPFGRTPAVPVLKRVVDADVDACVRSARDRAR